MQSIDKLVNPVITETFRPNFAYSANPLQIYIFIASVVWVIGIATLLLYTAVSYIHFRYLLKDAVLMKENLLQEDIDKRYIFQSDRIEQSLVFGIVKPRIYIPYTLAKEELASVIAHEKTHIKRRDYIWKPLAFFIAILYWFHPLVWIAYVLFSRDIELSCDEGVIKNMDVEQRKSYSRALLDCSSPKKLKLTCPLAFGETNVKNRIKNVLNYKRPPFWILISAIIVAVLAAVFFMTNPETSINDLEAGNKTSANGSEAGDETAENNSDTDDKISDSNMNTKSKSVVNIPPDIVLEDTKSGKKIYEDRSTGTYSWTYFVGDIERNFREPASKGDKFGEWHSIEMCGESPLCYITEENYLSQSKDGSIIQIKFVTNSNVIVEPEKITVSVYDLTAIGNAEAVELNSQEITNSTIKIESERVYLLNAYWNYEGEEAYEFSGNAQYIFVTE